MSRCLANAASSFPLSLPQDYATAHEDFQQSLALNRNQPIAMLYKGLTFFHRGLLKVTVVCVVGTVCGLCSRCAVGECRGIEFGADRTPSQW